MTHDGRPRVDCHSHFLPRSLDPASAGLVDRRWPRVDIDASGDAGVLVRPGTPPRPVEALYWSLDRRLESMDRHGIGLQVVSPLPPLLAYGGPPEEAAQYARTLNEALAEHVAAADGRLVGLGTLPLGDVDTAIEELDHLDDLGLIGVEIGTVIDGTELDAPSLRPFWQAVAQRGTPVFLHPVEGESVNRISNPVVRFGLGVPTDTALTFAAIFTSGLLEEHPGIRLHLPHGGGSFAWSLMRLEPLWRRFTAGAPDGERRESPREAARRVHVDLASVDAAGLAFLLHTFGVEQMMIGSDYPGGADQSPVQALADHAAATGAGAELADAIGGANAARFYGLDRILERLLPQTHSGEIP